MAKIEKTRGDPEKFEQMRGGNTNFFVDFCFERPIPPAVNNERYLNCDIHLSFVATLALQENLEVF